MWYVAFTLGLFGSLHCVGMCGPLALAFAGGSGGKWSALGEGLAYHAGRTSTYMVLGLLFGLAGNAMMIAGIQQWLSILIGILMVLSFIASIDVDHAIGKSAFGVKWRKTTSGWVQRIYDSTSTQPRFVLGLVNGLLPCGLVYLALAGALSSSGVWQGGLFMVFFGLGTIPAMIALTMGKSLAGKSLRSSFRKVLPYVTLVFGLFMIYRGLAIHMPAELDFWTAIKNPILCH